MKTTTFKIGKKHYSFRRAYKQVPIGDIPQIQKELRKVLGITDRYYFSTKLNQGFKDPRISIIESVEKVFKRYQINNPWEVTESKKSEDELRSKAD